MGVRLPFMAGTLQAVKVSRTQDAAKTCFIVTPVNYQKILSHGIGSFLARNRKYNLINYLYFRFIMSYIYSVL